jgi:hypothetical protein
MTMLTMMAMMAMMMIMMVIQAIWSRRKKRRKKKKKKNKKRESIHDLLHSVKLSPARSTELLRLFRTWLAPFWESSEGVVTDVHEKFRAVLPEGVRQRDSEQMEADTSSVEQQQQQLEERTRREGEMPPP